MIVIDVIQNICNYSYTKMNLLLINNSLNTSLKIYSFYDTFYTSSKITNNSIKHMSNLYELYVHRKINNDGVKH